MQGCPVHIAAIDGHGQRGLASSLHFSTLKQSWNMIFTGWKDVQGSWEDDASAPSSYCIKFEELTSDCYTGTEWGPKCPIM